jgi:hypothetical protein
MEVLVKDVTELRGPQIDAQLTEPQRALWVEIRKRMPGIRVGFAPGVGGPLLYFADELLVRGAFGFNSKNFGESPTYFIRGPFIRKERGEHYVSRSKSAATLARKAKDHLRAWTLHDRAKRFYAAATNFAASKTPQEEEWGKIVRDAKKLGVPVTYYDPPVGLVNAMRHATIPDANYAHASRVLAEDMDRKAAAGAGVSPVYVAVYEKHGVPVYDYCCYETNVVSEALPQANMPPELYERLSTLNILGVHDKVARVGVRASDFEFIINAPDMGETN